MEEAEVHCSLLAEEDLVGEGARNFAEDFAGRRGSGLADPGFVGRLACCNSAVSTVGYILAVVVGYILGGEVVDRNRLHHNYFAGRSQRSVEWTDEHSSVGIDPEAGKAAVQVRSALRIGHATADLEEEHLRESDLQEDPFHLWYRTMDR